MDFSKDNLLFIGVQMVVQFFAGHGQLTVRILVEPIPKIGFDLLRPLGVYLSRGIGFFSKPLKSELVAKRYHFRRKYQISDQMGGNKDNTMAIGEHHITGQYGGPSDTDRAY